MNTFKCKSEYNAYKLKKIKQAVNDATRAVYSCLVKCTMYITKQVYQVPLDTNLNKKKNLEWNQRPTQHEPFSTVANCRAYIMKQVNQLALNIIHKEIEVP